ncbi:MAG: acetyl/propionyl/methylcrotonyl-CoA carboxylase subunit alpha [Planctomycetota bacterium]
MFHKLLIANRGEVAVRIARTARALSIATVGVVSDADRGARWTKAFDEVVCIGGSAPKDSYLRAERIVQVARQTGASAIHPGWGFLAENARFAALCEQHGITFVGPSPAVMQKMGLKSPAKEAMRAAGLPVIPGSLGLLRDVAQGVEVARSIGYPVILKADAGGGGRGMRLARDEGSLREAYAAASAEAQAAFGNGALYLEKYLTGGRHIEVQVLGDRHGHAVHLFERECSIQRNHQKLIEESPSPALTPRERDELGAATARAAAALGYSGAGTVEYLRDEHGELFFMEMNTRLQVEHPVTEMITGIDVVAEQLRAAARHPLRLEQRAITASGHAIECRINAEDPANAFRPSPGVLARFEIPTDRGPGRVRVDTHLGSGDEVVPYYDSLIAKVIAHAPTRAGAIETLLRTLTAAQIQGVATTVPLHLAVLQSPEFGAGEYDTRSIPGWRPAAERETTRPKESSKA